MPEPGQIIFTHKEIVEVLLRKEGITQGIWALYVKFGLKAINIGESPASLNPAAIVPILELGLQRFKEESNISVDAGKLNKTAKKGKRKR